ncbi:unnamed protein product, partial [Ectocarpus fasciculatus]
FSFISRVANAVWNELPLTLLVHMTTSSDLRVGLVAGVAGICQLLGAPLAAYVADKNSRSWVLRAAGVVTIVAIAVTVFSVYLDYYTVLLSAMALWGFSNAASNPTADAVIADTVAAGERSAVYTLRSQLMQLGAGVGPAVALVMFAVLGDEWKMSELRYIIYTGLAVQLVPAYILLTFPLLASPQAVGEYAAVRSDDLHDEEQSLGITSNIRREDESIENSNICINNDARIRNAEGVPDVKLVTQSGRNIDLEMSHHHQQALSSGIVDSREFIVPLVIVVTDVFSMLASGMSVKFFGVFFKENMHMAPATVTLMYMVPPIATSISLKVTQRLSKYTGRLPAAVGVKMLGIVCFILMIILYKKSDNKWIIGGLFILRTALMNSPKPLMKSVIMDLVPASERARWNSVESINAASWAGSAMLGGYIIDKYGIIVNFTITVLVQIFVGTAPLILVSSYIPAENDASS